MVLNFPTSPINGQVSNDFYFDSSVGTEGAWRSSPVPIGGLPAGSIIQWAGATAPANWLIADGSAVSRTANASLFAVIGTTYGSGDGSTTFNLPDLRGRVAVGRDGSQTEFDVLGETGGAKTHAHGSSAMTAGLWAGYWKGRTGASWTATNSGGITAPGGNSTTTTSGVSIEGSTDSGSSLQPYLVTNYIIKATAGWSAGDSELAQRVGVLEAAPAGLVRVVPTSVSVSSGSASVSATGLISLSSATDVRIQGVFSSAFRHYRIVADLGTAGAPENPHQVRFIQPSGTPDSSAGYTYTNFYQQGGVTGAGAAAGSNQTVGSYGYAQMFTLEVFSPFLNSFTLSQFNGIYAHTFFLGQCGFNGVTSFSGINFLNNTLGGTIQVYGYRN